MNKKVFIIIIIAIVIGLTIWLVSSNVFVQDKTIENDTKLDNESMERKPETEAELVGYNFMLDFFEIIPPKNNLDAVERVYNALSAPVQAQLKKETIAADMVFFIGVEDAPGQGISIIDFQETSEKTAMLSLALNYSEKRVIRNINLVFEENEWKIDSVFPGADNLTSSNLLDIPAVIAVVDFVAGSRNLDKKEVTVLSAIDQDWPNGCLGLGTEDEICTQAIVSGYQVTLSINEKTETFRVDLEGLVIRQE
jgi:hypothetical protein